MTDKNETLMASLRYRLSKASGGQAIVDEEDLGACIGIIDQSGAALAVHEIIGRGNDAAHLSAARMAYFAAGGSPNDPFRAQKVSRIQVAIANGSNGALAPPGTSELIAALRALVDLNDGHSPFGGELYQDRIARAWDRARAALAKASPLPPMGTESGGR